MTDRPGHDRRYALDCDQALAARLDAALPVRATRWQTTVRWYRDHDAWWRPLKSGEFRAYYERQYGSPLRAHGSHDAARRLAARHPGVAARARLAPAGRSAREPRPNPDDLPAMPTYVQRVAPDVVGLRVRAAETVRPRPRLGAQRFGAPGSSSTRADTRSPSATCCSTPSRIEARVHDGRPCAARAGAASISTPGLAVVQLEGDGPWPAATLVRLARRRGRRAHRAPSGVDEDGDLVRATSTLQAVRRFSAYWEYMLDRALMLAPGEPVVGRQRRRRRAGPRDRHRLAPAGRAAAREPRHPGREVLRREGRADGGRPRGEPAAAPLARPLHDGRAGAGGGGRLQRVRPRPHAPASGAATSSWG